MKQPFKQSVTVKEYKAMKKAKPSKYRNVKTVVDGITFDSKKEAKRYRELMLLQKEGHIKWVLIQKPLPFCINDEVIFKYIADFVYIQNRKIIYEDVKGIRTPVYKLKKKLIEAKYKIKITEI